MLALPDAVRSRPGFDMDYESSLGVYDHSVLLPPDYRPISLDLETN